MKHIILVLLLTFSTHTVQSKEKEILVKVLIENISNTELSYGELYIVELDKTIEVTNVANFEISVPKKGEYQFIFKADGFMAYTYYPNKISTIDNTITILLGYKYQEKCVPYSFSYPIQIDMKLTDAQIKERLANGSLNFILNGIDASIPHEYVLFKEKYGVGLVKENCAMDPLSFIRATENNLMIANYLDRVYGENWILELELKPFGVK